MPTLPPSCHFFAGIDEAGLGPTLGPLVVAVFATRGVAHELRMPLADAIGEPGVRPPRLEVGDSKRIHSGAHKLARLERTVLATVQWIHGVLPATVGELFALVRASPEGGVSEDTAPWYQDLGETLPIAADRAELAAAGERLARAAARAGIEGIEYRADIISAQRFNEELAAELRLPGGSKNSWSTHAMLLRAAALERSWPAAAWTIACDRSGGRASYGSALVRAFPAHQLRVNGERREHSAYSLSRAASATTAASELEISFFVGADRVDPRVAWASCLAKYCRELVMRAFNRYWCARLPGLRPTAGYPEDARRFLAEVEDLADRLGFPSAEWIRGR